MTTTVNEMPPLVLITTRSQGMVIGFGTFEELVGQYFAVVEQGIPMFVFYALASQSDGQQIKARHALATDEVFSFTEMPSKPSQPNVTAEEAPGLTPDQLSRIVLHGKGGSVQ